MVSGGGGETDEKKKLKEQLRRRKNKAEERRAKLREAIINAGDDGILEGIYDNLQVRMQGQMEFEEWPRLKWGAQPRTKIDSPAVARRGPLYSRNSQTQNHARSPTGLY